jgi:hypothetical protein
MNTDRSDLANRFRELSDDELLSRCSSGDLNEVAQSVAIQELASRGLHLPGPVDTARASTEYEGDFETVARFLNPTDAHIVCSCLQAAGVPAAVADANLVQMGTLWAAAVGGVRILVPAARVAEAREVIAAYNRGDYALPDEGEPQRGRGD